MHQTHSSSRWVTNKLKLTLNWSLRCDCVWRKAATSIENYRFITLHCTQLKWSGTTTLSFRFHEGNKSVSTWTSYGKGINKIDLKMFQSSFNLHSSDECECVCFKQQKKKKAIAMHHQLLQLRIQPLATISFNIPILFCKRKGCTVIISSTSNAIRFYSTLHFDTHLPAS